MQSMPHICTIEKKSSGSGLPPIPDRPGFWPRLRRILWKSRLVSDRDPRIIEYFRSSTGLMDEKRRHIESKYSYMIHPFSKMNYVHEAVMTVVYLEYFLIFPYILAFRRKNLFTLELQNILVSIANIVCIVDIILRFFTGYVDQKMKVTILNQKLVARHYIMSVYFFCDVGSSLPTDIYGYLYPDSAVARYLHYLRVLRLVRLNTFLTYFERTTIFIPWNKMVLLAICYTMIVTIVLHWVSCLNYYIPFMRVLLYGHKHKHSWLVVKSRASRYRQADRIMRSSLSKYQASFFRTAGFILAARSSTPDDFVLLARKARKKSKVPVDDIIFDFPLEELLMDIFNMILGKILTSTFAVVIICRIFELYTLETKYQAIMNQLNEFMKNKKLPLAMRDRLVKYYEHRYQKKYFKEEVITEILSENLRKEVNINVCRQLVHMVNIFSELPPHILSDVLAHLKAEVYLPNDIIIKSGTVGDCMYFLASGTVSVYTPSGREVCHLQDGAYFGEISLILKNTKRTTDIIAIEMCEVFRLDKKAFRSCFKYDRYGVFEKMQQIAEQRLQQTALLEESYKLELFQKAYTEKL